MARGWTGKLGQRMTLAVRRAVLLGALAVAVLVSMPVAAAQATTCPSPNGDAYSTAVLADGPIAYYRLDEASGPTMCDSSTSGNDGTYNSSGITYGITGALKGSSDTAVSADGTPGVIGTSNSNSPIAGNQSFTLEGWFKSTGTTQNQALVDIGQAGTGNAAGLALWPNANACGGIALDEYDGYNCWGGVNLFDGNWHYLAVTYDASAESNQLTAYVDGQSLGSQSPTNSINLSASPVRVGQWVDTVINQPFNGDADEVAVYPTALAASQILAHYQAAGYGVGPTVSGISPSSGPSTGGTSVTITGSGFTGATAVDFGSRPAASFTVDSDSQIRAVSPPGSGSVNVTVTTPAGTSATSSADVFTYTTTSPFPPPTTTTPPPTTTTPPPTTTTPPPTTTTPPPTTTTPPPTTTQPAIVSSSPVVQSSSSAGFTGIVNPEGALTTAYFQYGLDPSYTGGGATAAAARATAHAAGTVTYTGEVTAQPYPVGSDFSPHTVTASASGLVPNALYHVRLVAVSGIGTTYGPDQTFTTNKDPAPGAPVLGQSFNAVPVSGQVYVRLPGVSSGALSAHVSSPGPGFIPLTEVRQLPMGTQVDTRSGTIRLINATGNNNKLQNATFSGAIFNVSQASLGANKGLTTVKLLYGAFPGAPSYASCKAKTANVGQALAQVAVSGSVLSTLHSRSHGRYSSSGHYGSATSRGTAWTITDRCDGTLIAVQKDTVVVRDFVHHRTFSLHAGQRYLIKAP